jgi:two-component system cell cycle sensor histidine kinase/response regulator CckA
VSEEIDGTHTILLVEDSEDLRQLMERMLERCGYRVLPAGDAEDALGVEERYRGVIHLLISDMIMPGLSGSDLAQRIMQRRPAIQVLFISGNPNGEGIERFIGSANACFLMKPFPPDALESKVRECLSRHESKP